MEQVENGGSLLSGYLGASAPLIQSNHMVYDSYRRCLEVLARVDSPHAINDPLLKADLHNAIKHSVQATKRLRGMCPTSACAGCWYVIPGWLRVTTR